MKLISTLALMVVMIAAIGRAVWQWEGAGIIAGLGLGLYMALEVWQAKRGACIMTACAAMSGLLGFVLLAEPVLALEKAAIAAASLIGLFVALGFLRDAAETSPMVASAGTYMVRLAPSKRYLGLALGSHLISIVLNFGVLPLIGTMINRGNTLSSAGGDTKIHAIRRQRMLTAMMRGFVVMTVWSPLSVSFAVTQNVVQGIDWMVLLPLQLILTLLLLVLGFVLDRKSYPVPQTPAQPHPSEIPGQSFAPIAKMIALVSVVVMASIGAAFLLDTRLVVGAMVAVPVAGFVWLWVQKRDLAATLAHQGQKLRLNLPNFRDEVGMLGGAMFLGTMVVQFVPVETTAALIQSLNLPPVMLVVLLSWSLMLLAQIGISQIITVTILGGAMANLSQLGIQPLALASGLMGAWALSVCITPVGACVLTVARLGEVSIAEVSRKWNGTYVLIGAILLAIWLIILSEILDHFPALG